MTAASRRARRALTVGAVSAVAALGIAWQSAVVVPMRNAGRAHLRLSWSAHPERIETCRALSEKEIQEREEHMRQRVDCEGHSATYRLSVVVGDVAIAHSVVRGGGLRHDRPIHLLRDFAIPPGRSRLRVSLVRVERAEEHGDATLTRSISRADTGLFAGRAEREEVERARRARAAIPARLELDTMVAFAPGRVTLVTFDADRRSLRVVTER